MRLWARWLQVIWLPALIVGAWQVASTERWLDPLFFPPPTELVAMARKMAISGELWRHVGSTLHRIVVGMAMGATGGIVLGLLMGVSGFARKALEPLFSALNATPKLALFPLVLLFLGVGETSRLFLIAAAPLVPVAILTLDAVRNIPRGYVEMAENYGATRAQVLRRVYLPASLPQILSAVRVALGRCLVTTISVEIIGSPSGIGNLIWMGWQTLATEKLYIGVILSGTMGITSHRLLRRLERGLAPWKA